MSILEFSDVKPRQEKIQNCELCPYFTTSVFLMVDHVKRHHSTLPRFNCENSKIEDYRCKDCNFQTDLTLVFSRHVQLHSEPSNQNPVIRQYFCENCSFDTHFAMKWLQHTLDCLKIPKIVQSDKIKHFCDKCPYKARYKVHLQRHVNARHLDEGAVTWYKCEKCSYKAKQKGNLKIHQIARHLDEQNIKWYQCEQCTYKAKQKKKHLKNHTVRKVHL